MPRTRLPLTRGLDRASNTLLIDPSAQGDVRNFIAEGGSLTLRAGLQATGWPAVSSSTDIVCVAPFRLKKEFLLVTYDRSTRAVKIERVNPINPATRQTVATWGTLNANAMLPPVILAAEHSGYVLFAHAEPNISYRLTTKYYTPDAVDANVGTLTSLQADFDNSGVAADVKFFGLEPWGTYLLGWGYGDESSTARQDTPEVLRISLPGDPLTWPLASFSEVGMRDDPILAVRVADAASMPIISKARETYVLLGQTPSEFEVRRIDNTRGVISPRASVAAAGAVFAWSATGPIVANGDGAPAEIDVPLGLLQGEPTTLPAKGSDGYAWAVYDSEARVVWFLFPDAAATPATRAYGYCLRGANGPEWVYASSALCLMAGAEVPYDKVAPPAVTAYASNVSLTDTGVATDAASRSARIVWDNNSYLGDEDVEVYAREDGGTWVLLATVAISGISQTLDVEGFSPLASVDVALRAIRRGAVKTGYEDANPDNWTGATVAGAKDNTVLSCGTPVIGSVTYARVSPSQTQLTVVFTLADLYVDVQVEKRVNSGAWSVVTTLDGSLAPRTYAYTPTAGEAGATIDFRLRPVHGSTYGTYSNILGTVNGYTVTASLLAVWNTNHTNQTGSARGSMKFIVELSSQQSFVYLDIEYRVGAGAWTSYYSAGYNASILRKRTIVSVARDALPVGSYSADFRVRCRSSAGDTGAWSGTFTRTVTDSVNSYLHTVTPTSPTFPAWGSTPAARSMQWTVSSLGTNVARVYIWSYGDPAVIDEQWDDRTSNSIYSTRPAGDSGKQLTSFSLYLIDSSYRELVPQQGSTYRFDTPAVIP